MCQALARSEIIFGREAAQTHYYHKVSLIITLQIPECSAQSGEEIIEGYYYYLIVLLLYWIGLLLLFLNVLEKGYFGNLNQKVHVNRFTVTSLKIFVFFKYQC